MAVSSNRQVLLGIPDQPIEQDCLTPLDSKLGGLPVRVCVVYCAMDIVKSLFIVLFSAGLLCKECIG